MKRPAYRILATADQYRDRGEVSRAGGKCDDHPLSRVQMPWDGPSV